MQARGKTEGFALVIALTLMAFILMLLLSMSTLVRLETRSSIDRLRAQNNALMALSVAIGQLQKTAGPDQRVTARAVSYTHLTLPPTPYV